MKTIYFSLVVLFLSLSTTAQHLNKAPIKLTGGKPIKAQLKSNPSFHPTRAFHERLVTPPSSFDPNRFDSVYYQYDEEFREKNITYVASDGTYRLEQFKAYDSKGLLSYDSLVEHNYTLNDTNTTYQVVEKIALYSSSGQTLEIRERFSYATPSFYEFKTLWRCTYDEDSLRIDYFDLLSNGEEVQNSTLKFWNSNAPDLGYANYSITDLPQTEFSYWEQGSNLSYFKFDILDPSNIDVIWKTGIAEGNDYRIEVTGSEIAPRTYENRYQDIVNNIPSYYTKRIFSEDGEEVFFEELNEYNVNTGNFDYRYSFQNTVEMADNRPVKRSEIQESEEVGNPVRRIEDNFYYDRWVSTSIKEKLQAVKVVVFPNPTSGIIQIRGLSGTSNLKWYNTQGMLIREQTVTPNQPVDISEFATGVYTLRLTNANQSQVLRIFRN
ncbi:MAG TPA: T9SS type A sorting domain-containing protein [Luteibaculaceae bacterium]|nr:T9SS type A sorting domain-containing protein [Luteibaculaceae bacterium]